MAPPGRPANNIKMIDLGSDHGMRGISEVNDMKGIRGRILRQIVLWVGLWLAAGQGLAQEPLVFSAAPRETPEQGEQLYGPLVERMSEVLGVPVIYRHPGSWLTYQRDMRNDAYDILLDGPHLIAWRMAELNHRPVARMPGTLRFYLLVREGDDSVGALQDLVARKICSVAPPNLAPLVMLAEYPDVIRQPVIHSARRGMRQAFDEFRAGECDAVALPTNFYHNQLSDDERRGTRILFESPPLPNQGFSVGERVDEVQSARLRELMTATNEPAVAAVLRTFARDAQVFIPANDDEYRPHDRLLKGVLFGW